MIRRGPMDVRVPWVPRCAAHGIGSPGAIGNLDGLGLADQNAAAGEKSTGERRGRRGCALGVNFGTTGGHQTRNVDEILEREGNAVEWANAVTVLDRLGGSFGGLAGTVGEHDFKGLEFWLQYFDALEDGVDNVRWREFSIAVTARQVSNGEQSQIGHESMGP